MIFVIEFNNFQILNFNKKEQGQSTRTFEWNIETIFIKQWRRGSIKHVISNIKHITNIIKNIITEFIRNIA